MLGVGRFCINLWSPCLLESVLSLKQRGILKVFFYDYFFQTVIIVICNENFFF